MKIRFISCRFTIQLCKYAVSNPVYRLNSIPLGTCGAAIITIFTCNGFECTVVAPPSRGRSNENLKRQIAVRIFSGCCTPDSFAPSQFQGVQTPDALLITLNNIHPAREFCEFSTLEICPSSLAAFGDGPIHN